MVLSEVTPGENVKLKAINGGRGLKSKLYSLGLVPGVNLKVLCGESAGPVMICIRDSKLALGRGMAEKIIVDGEG